MRHHERDHVRRQRPVAAVVERLERVEEDIKAYNADKSEIYAEAKANGFDVKVIKKIIAIRRRPAADVAEEEAILELYLQAIGEPLVRARAA